MMISRTVNAFVLLAVCVFYCSAEFVPLCGTILDGSSKGIDQSLQFSSVRTISAQWLDFEDNRERNRVLRYEWAVISQNLFSEKMESSKTRESLLKQKKLSLFPPPFLSSFFQSLVLCSQSPSLEGLLILLSSQRYKENETHSPSFSLSCLVLSWLALLACLVFSCSLSFAASLFPLASQACLKLFSFFPNRSYQNQRPMPNGCWILRPA